MGKGRISKYENAIVLLVKRARKSWECHSCDSAILPGDHYYRQSLGLIRKPPGVILNAFCLECGKSPRNKVLDTSKGVNPYLLSRNKPSQVGIGSRDKTVVIQQSLFSWKESVGK